MSDKLHCSVSTTSAFFGEPWSMLLLREFMLFGGTRRFEQLYNALGISRNVLTKRLRRLMELEMIKKSPVSENSKRMEYKLRRKAWELMPVMLALHQWAERWVDDVNKSQLDYADALYGKPLAKVEVRSQDGRTLEPGDVRVIPKIKSAEDYLKKYSSKKVKLKTKAA